MNRQLKKLGECTEKICPVFSCAHLNAWQGADLGQVWSFPRLKLKNRFWSTIPIPGLVLQGISLNAPVHKEPLCTEKELRIGKCPERDTIKIDMRSRQLFTSPCFMMWAGLVLCSTAHLRPGFMLASSAQWVPSVRRTFPSSAAFWFLPFHCCSLQPSWICMVSTRSRACGGDPPLCLVGIHRQKVSPSKGSAGVWSGTPAPLPSSGGMIPVTMSCCLNTEAVSASQRTA